MKKPDLLALLLILSTFLLSACKNEITPEWERFYSQAQADESRVEWLSNVAVDSYGDIITAGSTVLTGGQRTQNVLFVKQDSNGSIIWTREYDLAQGAYRSDDKITDIVLDDEGNIYAVGVQYIVQNDQQRYGSFMLKVDRYGDVNWVRNLSDQEDARDIEIHSDKLYVTGFASQVFDLNGQRLLKVNHEKAWDIEIDASGDFYVVGAKKAEKYAASGQKRWSVALQAGLNPQASIALRQDGSAVIAHNHDDRTTRVSGISSNGQIQWNRKYNPAKQSYGFPGPALVKTDWRGNSIISLSNDRGRRLVKLDDLGKELWQATSTGIVHDFLIGDDDAIYAVGGGVNEKYAGDGKFIASTRPTSGTQITTGSIAMDGDTMYVAYSAVNNGDIDFYLAKFIDQ